MSLNHVVLHISVTYVFDRIIDLISVHCIHYSIGSMSKKSETVVIHVSTRYKLKASVAHNYTFCSSQDTVYLY